MGSKWFWGLLFGIVAIILLAATLYVRSIAPGSKRPRPSSAATSAPAPTQNPPPTISLTTPKEDVLNTSGTARIAGTTQPQTIVAITGGAEEIIVESDDNGTFAAETPLRKGLNSITVTAFREEDGAESSVERNIVYDEEGE